MVKEGKKTWYIVDGWLPGRTANENANLEGHEAIMILNCKEMDAQVLLDIFYETKEPLEGIKIDVPAKRSV